MLTAMGLAGLAAALAVTRPRLLPACARADSVGETSARVWPWIVAAVAVIVVVTLLGGARAGVLTSVGMIVLATGARVVIMRRRQRRTHHRAAGVSQACTVLAAEMELGKVPTAALAAAAEDCPELTHAAAAAAIGGGVVDVWLRQGTEPGAGGLIILARAWQVSVNTGAPLGPSLETVAAALRADEEVDRLVAGELAAPRMTGLVLALLPVGGVGLGYLIGGDPIDFLTGTPWGWACLLAGCLLTCAGVLWTEHLGKQE